MNNTKSFLQPRAIAAQTVEAVVGKGRSLDASLTQALSSKQLSREQKAAIFNLVQGTIRYYFNLNSHLMRLAQCPLERMSSLAQAIILISFFEIEHQEKPPYAVVNEAVESARTLKLNKGTQGFVNAILRNFLRQKEAGAPLEVAAPNNPDWLIDEFKAAWPNELENILNANDEIPPVTLRINQQRTNLTDFRQVLQDNDIDTTLVPGLDYALQLNKSVPFHEIPSFSDGFFSAQDGAGQYLTTLLDLKSGMNLLDACAAPGSKTCAMLEEVPDLKVTALEIDAKRITRLTENLERLGLHAKTICNDGLFPDRWWDGLQYDRIIIDAPCSGTGVIRRNPDIKIHRQPADIRNFKQTQLKMLNALSKTLKPDGLMMYSTCSILPEENDRVIQAFLKANPGWEMNAIELPVGRKTSFGWQILPGEANCDGFYYASLKQSRARQQVLLRE